MALTDAQIAALRRLNGERTAGRWWVVGAPWGDGTFIVAGNGDPHVSQFVCDCEDPSPESDDRDYSVPDAAFIVACANSIGPALDEIERLTALVTQQKERIDWLLDARGGAAYHAAFVADVLRDREGLRSALRDALRFVANVPVDVMRGWQDALRGVSLAPPPAPKEE